MSDFPADTEAPKTNPAVRLVGAAYRKLIRRFLPDTVAVRYSNIPVAITKKLGDDLLPQAVLPFMHHDIADYEATLIGALRDTLRSGDRVVVVGGGLGVTAVAAARAVGGSGAVTCFEGSAEQIRLMQTTFARNDLACDIDVRHAIVGRNIGVYGQQEAGVPVLPAAELPACDVLELDCEGAEIPILENLAHRPPTIIVETHGLHGAPTDRVSALLDALGYDVEDRGWAEPSRLQDCKSGDIRILVGRARGA
jgi:hypothetical protein